MQTPSKPLRGIINAKDICNMTGVTIGTARRYLRRVRQACDKPSGSLVTVMEFCWCMGLPEEFVREFVS
jgi:hypothetical protein